LADRLLFARGPIAAAPLVATVVGAWAMLEDPVAWRRFVAIAALALAPAVARGPGTRAAVAAAAAVGALAVAFGTWPQTALGDAWTALHDAPAVRAPFEPAAFPALHGLVLIAAFGVGLVAALAVVSRRMPLAVAAAVVGIGFPARLLQDGNALALGALALAAVLWALLVPELRGVRRTAPGAAVGVLVLALAVGAASGGIAPDEGRIDWRGWDPFAGSGRTASLRYIWDANYSGIEFPPRPTVVLRIRAPKRAEYWRVSTLETFAADRWIENLYPVDIGGARRSLPNDPLVPDRDEKPGEWLSQAVTVEGLEDDRLAAAGQPARVDGASLGRLSFLAGGVLRATRPLRRGAEDRVWSYAPRPTPRVLAASTPRYPAEAGRYLELGRARVPGFGSRNRVATIDRLLRDDRYQPLWAYRPLWEEAQRRTARARSPYEATLLLERWFRREGGFRYEEQPPTSPSGRPPLVDFVEVNRAGYCQHYAGAMAVMLRLLGVPARVAVGFTAGTWKGGVWTVTDHQAHAWVEAWFDGFGWLTFDPTPGRGTLSAVYTLASDSADAVAALGTGRFLDFNPSFEPNTPATPTPVEATASRTFPWWLVALPLVPLLAGAAVIGGKWARRTRRLRQRDPRALATGVRAELVAALIDRGAVIASAATTTELRRSTERVFRLPVGALIDALAEARFGPGDGARAAAVRARTELGRVLGTVRARETPGARLRAAVSLRSLTRSAR
jgi:transglutaminase-like putative cysteine protease